MKNFSMNISLWHHHIVIHQHFSLRHSPIRTVVIVGLAVYSRESRSTRANIRIDVLPTCGAVLTGVGCTLVDVDLTACACESSDTDTRAGAAAVDACTTVQTGVWKGQTQNFRVRNLSETKSHFTTHYV